MPSAKRIICVGHAALDRIYRIEAFPPEPTKVRALEHVEAGGGMAANAAVTIARLGGRRSCGAVPATTLRAARSAPG
jgi:sugar/nucleoside kinase (ribokinase family)